MAPTNKGNNIKLCSFTSCGKSEIIGHKVEEKDRRLRLSHERMEMLLCIYINDKNWTTSEREEIINRSVELYVEKCWETRLAAAYVPPTKKRKDQENESEQIVDSGDDENIVHWSTEENDLKLEGFSERHLC